MRWRAPLGLILFLLALLVGWATWARPRVEDRAGPWVEATLSRLTGRPVSVGVVRIHPLLLSASVDRVRVGAPEAPIFTCRRWTIRTVFSSEPMPFSVLFFGPGRSRVESPVWRGGGSAVGSGPPLNWRSLPYHRVSWTGGDFEIPTGPGRPPLRLAGVDGELGLSPGGGVLRVRGTGDPGRWWMDVGVADSLRVTPLFSGRGRLVLEDVDLGVIAPFWPNDWGAVVGRAGVDVSIAIQDYSPGPSVGRPRWARMTPKGEIRFKDARWRPRESTPRDWGVPLSGRVTLEGSRLRFHDTGVLDGLRLSGSVEGLTKTARLDLALSARDWGVENLRRSGFTAFRPLPPAGRVDGEVVISGTLEKPELAWRASLKGLGVPGAVLPPLEATGTWRNDWFSTRVNGLSGTVDVDGTLAVSSVPASGGPLLWAVKASGLSLDDVAAVNGWSRVRGRVDGALSLLRPGSGGTDRPRAEGRLRIEGFEWGLHRETAPVEGRLILDDRGLRVTGAGGGLRLNVERAGDDWRIESLDYRAGALHLWGAGFLSDAEGRLGLRGGVEGLAATDFPPIGSRFPDAQGAFSADGRWTGRWTSPVFDGTVRLDALRWRPGGLVHNIRAEVHGESKAFRIERLEVDDVLTAAGEWSAGRSRWRARLTPTPVERLLDFQKDTGSLRGIVSGEIELETGRRPGWEGAARLDWRDGGVGPWSAESATARLVFAGDTVTLESFDARQRGGGRLTAQAVAVREREIGGGRPTAWRGTASGEALNFGAGRRAWTSRWTAQARHEWRTARTSWTVVSPGARCGDVDLGALAVQGRWTPTAWGVDDARSSRGAVGSFAVQGASRTLLGQWRAAGVDPRALWPKVPFPADWRRGEVGSEGTLGGTWDRPRAAGRVVGRADWRDVSVRAEGRFAWENDSLAVDALTASFEDGGVVVASGTVGASPAPGVGWSHRPVSLKARVESVRLEGLFRSLSLPRGWRTALTGALEGAGTGLDFRADGRFAAAGATAAGEAWTGGARVRFASRTFTLEDVLVHTSEGRWGLANGARAVRRDAGWDVDLINQMRNIRLGPLRFFGDLRVAGRWDAAGASARLVAQPLWVNQRRYEQSLTRVSWRPGEIRFSAVPGDPTTLEGSVNLSAWPRVVMDNIVLRDRGARRLGVSGVWSPTEWDFRLDAVDVGAETLLSLANADWPVTGFWNVRLRGQGSAAAPDVAAEIQGRDGRVGAWPYDRLEAAAQWRGDAVDLRRLRLSRRNGYVLTGEGRLPIRTGDDAAVPPTLRLSLTNGRLQMLPDVWAPCLWAKGSFAGALDLGVGPDGLPRAMGALDLRDGRLAARAYTPRVNDLNARFVLKDGRVWVEGARARVGRGGVELTGSVGLAGFGPADYDLRLRTVGDRGARVEVPQLSVRPGPLLSRWASVAEKLKGVSQGEPRFDLRLDGPHGAHRLTGDVFLERTQFTFPPSEKPRALRGPRWWRELWRVAEWNVVFHAGKNTWYGNEYIDAALSGDLRLAGHRKAWRASGKIETEEGSIRYLGQSFNVTRGVFEMITDTRPGVGFGPSIPYVSGQAEKTVTSLDTRGFAVNDTVTMVVDRAPLGEIQPRFVSRNNPDMKTERVAMRALGLSGDQQITSEERDQLLRAGLVQLLGASASPLALRLAKNFGIDMITTIYEPPETLETPGGATPSTAEDKTARTGELVDYLRGAGAAARIRVTDRLFGVYKVKWDEAQNQFFFRDEIELVYRVMGSLYARAGTELDSERLLGQPPERRVALENQWRFGFPRRKKQTSEDKK
ncbi:MAG: translocation/assembly module TamB domain-containing protein [Elusimicrobia bacterium]|nr:translocation/assembly module TamB domain-containing protein [Elusimicrobiota bacterium]